MRQHDPRRRARIVIRRIFVVGGLVILGMWAVALLSMRASEREAIEHASLEAGNLAAAFDDEVTRYLDGVSAAMEIVAGHMRKEGRPWDLAGWAQDIPALSSETIQLGIIGPDGRLVATTLDPHPKPIDLSDREHIRVHLQGRVSGLYIGEPVLGRVSHRVTIQVTRSVRTANGRLLGILVFSLAPGDLTSLHRLIDLGPRGAIVLTDLNNVVLARYTRADPSGLVAIGRSVGGGARPMRFPENAQGLYARSGTIDHVARLLAYRRLAKYPLVVTVGLDLNDVLAAPRREALLIAGVTGAATLLLIGMAVYLSREIRRRAENEDGLAAQRQELEDEVARRREAEQHAHQWREILQDAVDNVSVGLAIYDPDDRLLMANAAMRRLYPDDMEVMTPGQTFAEIMRSFAYSGYASIEIGHEEEWIAERLRTHRDPSGTFEQHLKDGRHVMATNRRMRNGGIASLRIDVTRLKETEARLREAQETLQDAVESIAEAFVIFDRDDRLVMWNEAYRRCFPNPDEVLVRGRILEELLRVGFERGEIPNARGREEEWLAERLRQHRELQGSVENLLPDGRCILISDRRMRNGGIAGLRVDITRLKQVESELRQTMENLDRVQRIAGIGSMEIDLDTELVRWSPGACAIFGLEPQDVVPTIDFLRSLIHPDDVDMADAAAQMANTSRVAVPPLEYRIVRPDGAVRAVYRENAIRYNASGRPVVRIVTYKDITVLKVTELRLRETMAHLDSVQRVAGIGSTTEDLLTGEYSWSPGACAIFGVDGNITEPTPEYMRRFYHSADRAKVIAAAEKSRQTGEPAPPLEYRIIRADGVERVVYRENAIEHDASGRPIRRIVTFKDITDLKAAEAQLRETMEHLDRVQRIAGIGSIDVDLMTGHVAWSLGACTIFGVDNDAIEPVVGYVVSLVHPDDRLKVEEAAAHSRATATAAPPLEYRIIRPDGATRVVYREYGMVVDPEGRPVRRIMTFKDITEIKATEAQLRESKEHLARAQRVAAIGSFELDLKTRAVFWSEELYRICGVTQAIGQLSVALFEDMLIPEDRPRVKAQLARVVAGEKEAELEYCIRRPDGGMRVLWREIELVRDGEGRPTKVIGIVKDVTELRAAERRRDELERQLQHSQKLEALGTLAGGIAHDLNNTLVPVLALSQLLLDSVSGADRADLETIILAARRAKELVQQILIFSRKQEIRKAEIDAAAVVRQAMQMLRATLPPGIVVVEEVGDVPRIFADAGQLQQVVVNLVTNAAHAIGAGRGSITVEMSLAAGSSVQIRVADTGCGMEAKVLQRVFEPFFTTKGVGEGTGLGLSMVHGIVAGHGGTIQADSEPGKGTVFTILLPIRENPAAPLEAAA